MPLSREQILALFEQGRAAELARTIDLGVEPGKAPPTEFRLFAAGHVETTKGVFIFDADAQDQVMKRAADYGNDYPVDYGHAMTSFFSLDPSESNKAAGWFTPAVRNGELWATSVSWTPKASKALSDREFRYCSPTFGHDEEGRVTELICVALTNLPATKRMDPLMADRKPAGTTGNTETTMKILLTKLGLAENATEAQALTALESHLAIGSKLLELTGKTDTREALGAVMAWRESDKRAVELSKQLATIEATSREAEVLSLVDAAVTAGKFVPAQRTSLLAMGRTDVAMLKGLVDATPAGKPLAKEPVDPGVVVSLSAADIEVAKKMNISLEAMAKSKADAIARGETRA